MEDWEKNEQNSDEITNLADNSAAEEAEGMATSEDEDIEDAVIVDSAASEPENSSDTAEPESASAESESSSRTSEPESVSAESESSSWTSEPESAPVASESSSQTSEPESVSAESESSSRTSESESAPVASESSSQTSESETAESDNSNQASKPKYALIELEKSVQASESEIADEIREIIAKETKSAEASLEGKNSESDKSSSEENEAEKEKPNNKPAAVLEELDRLKAESKEKTEAEPETSVDTVSDTVSADSQESTAISPEEISSDAAKKDSARRRPLISDFWKSFFVDIVFLTVCGFFIFAMAQKWFTSNETVIEGTNRGVVSLESGQKNTIGNINILMMGIDSVEGTHRSDTIFVLGVNPSKKKVTMLSIPRDTRVIIENKSRKINEILPRYGEPTLRKILEDLLKIKINKKAEVGFESFISVIDAIGGVDINIEKAMNYDDNWGNLHIHFKPGMNHLDGQQALNYVRFRKDAMADLGRIKRQQDFVKAVIKKLISPTVIVRLPSIIENVLQYIKTDFTLPEILTIVNGFDNFDIKLKTLSLPGEARYIDKVSYFLPYQEEAIAIGDSYFEDMAIFEIEKNFESKKIIPIDIPNRKKNK